MSIARLKGKHGSVTTRGPGVNMDDTWVFPKNRGVSPKMDGENNGKAPIKMDDLGVPPFSETAT